MDYSKRLEQSLKNFETETGKLPRINDLVREIGELTECFLKEGEDFQNAVKRLSELRDVVEKDCAMLSTFANNEETARQKLIADVHNTVTADSQQIIDKLAKLFATIKIDLQNLSTGLTEFAKQEENARQKLIADVHGTVTEDVAQIIAELSKPLAATNEELQKTCRVIDSFIAMHKKSQEKFLADTENILIKYNTKNLETYNNLLAALSSKIDLAKSAVENSLATQNSLISELSRKTDRHKSELESLLIAKLDAQNKKLSAEVETLKEKLSVLSYIKNAVTAAIGLGVLSCVIHFIK